MHKFTKFFVLMLFLSIFMCIANANAATINAASCSQADVQAAIDAASNGDTVFVPAGECTWTTVVQNKYSVVISGKSITLRGAGIDSTIINDGTEGQSKEEPLAIGGADGIRVTGLTFKGMKKRSTTEPAINIGSTNFRIDHCKFDASGLSDPGRGICVYGVYGVIDHCTVIDTKQGFAVFGGGDTSWTTPQSFGDANAVYVEDCTFTYTTPLDGALDAYGGARYVFRYNTVTNTRVGHHGCDSGGYRSVHSFEIYNNTYTTSIGQRAGFFRGGTGVIHNNTWNSTYTGLSVANYRSCGSYVPWGKCDGDNPIDGNTLPKTTYYGWPCQDQIGRTTNQASSPLYEWNNTKGGADIDIKVSDMSCAGSTPDMATHIKENRDFFNDTQRPGYTPYTYPHPLIKPSPPSNLRIVAP